MSALFGKCNFDSRPVDPHELDRVRSTLVPYGPDAEGCFCRENIGMVCRAFYATKESRLENQPHVTSTGAIIAWDGRLDNRQDLISQLSISSSTDSTDLSIFAAAYELWGVEAFAKLLGDWAASVWDARCQLLILAKDIVGTRHLYYSFDRDQVTWSTILDPLVLFAGRNFELCEEYIAGWLSSFPAVHLTPYLGIHSVPPASFVALRSSKRTIRQYWEFDPGKEIRHRTDSDYEEHFRSVFTEAVRRRLRADRPVLAELSGGMDSSAIVCVADTIMAHEATDAPRLDTVSYYDDSEPNWNERPYFTKVEEKRDRTGCHIDVSSQEPRAFTFDSTDFSVTPSSKGSSPSEADKHFVECLTSQDSRVVLSGIGGDEFMGGVPTPLPELENLLARAQFKTLIRQLGKWALIQRRPWLHLFLEAARRFFPLILVGVPNHRRPPNWLNSAFVSRHRAALRGYETHVHLLGPLPAFQESLNTFQAVRRQMGCTALPSNPTYEKRYPYLDRDLLEFIFAIPREQLVRPGQRRSLMRRAFVGIVPDELLNRKRKAFVARAPVTSLSNGWATSTEMSQQMVGTLLGIVDRSRLFDSLQKARDGQTVPIVLLMRTLGLETWLRNLRDYRVCGQH
jgi:asparagine synthase (glutamine-hydrolysing)